jgi:hypothetical protein
MRYIFLSLFTLLHITTGLISAQIASFPGAEGFGAVSSGGRGGKVMLVTNLDDSGAGSLRAAIQSAGSRIVVFRVSGTIELESSLNITNGNITIAGQTAPGEGICIKNYPIYIDADNVIIRFLRCRLGDESNTEEDAMSGRNHKKIIIDHCSMSWSVDECASFYDNEQFTMQYCLISESLYQSVHQKGNHGFGGIWGGRGASFHHNLLAHHSSRNPRWCGSRYSNLADQEVVDHRNNVIYNWGFNSCYGAEGGSYNMVGNYYKYGPATSPDIRDRIINPDADDGTNSQSAGIMGKFFISGNYISGNKFTTQDNWLGVDGVTATEKQQIRLSAPVSSPPITEQSAQEAFEYVITQAGAVLPVRDTIDRRVVWETVKGKASFGGVYGKDKGIIDTQVTAGGWPVLESAEAPADTDNDGMPDSWEDSNGLDRNNPDDRNGDFSGEGYTNIEYYINGLVDEFRYILRPVETRLDTADGLKVTIGWRDISDNETGFVIERKDTAGWAEIAVVAANETQFTDDNLPGYGQYYYRLRAANETMQSFSTDSIKVTVTDHTSIKGYKTNEAEIKVIPNPFGNTAKLVFRLEEPSMIEVSIEDISGRLQRNIAREFRNPGMLEYSIDKGELSSGIYFLRLTANDRFYCKKLMISPVMN